MAAFGRLFPAKRPRWIDTAVNPQTLADSVID
jgi:hypothetical protein